MNALRIHLPNEELWHRSGATYARGHAFLEHRLMSRDEFSHLISDQGSLDKFLHVLKQLNGFFAIVHKIGETVLVAEDRTRSFPLFYGFGKDAFYLGDDPRWVRDQVEDDGFDRLSASEFLLTGYVTGNDTLYAHVKQLRAGEVLIIRPLGSNPQVQIIPYYEYTHGSYLEKSPAELHVLMDEILLRVFRRLISFADGKTMVVPLSGGYDSRLITLMLKRLGYQSIVAFSYGRPGNAESQVSKEVARALGIRWEFVPYTNEAWSRWYRSEEYGRYRRMADGLVSVPHIQDWPAVWELTKHQVVPKDSVFVPGHTAIGGMYRVPTVTLRGTTMGEDQLISLVYDAEYELHDSSGQTEEIRRGIYEKIKTALGGRSSCNQERVADLYERWWWRERSAKFLINSVRAYEFWGYEWWLPFWDSELVDFWSRIPLAHRLRKSLHKSYTRKLESRVAGRNIREYKPPLSMPPIAFGTKMLYRTPFVWHVRRMLMLAQYDRHPFAWWGILPRKVHRVLCTGRGNINSILASDTLRGISQC